MRNNDRPPPAAAQVAALIDALARLFFGEPKPHLSSKKELRFGSRGSLAVDLRKGVWFDHETNAGGGVIDLVARQIGLTTPAQCMGWLEDQGFLTPRPRTNGRANGHARAAAAAEKLGPIVAEYDYTDEAGAVLFRVVRHDAPKTFRQWRADGNGGWRKEKGCMAGVRLVPYRLPELIEALAHEHPVFIVEGEKDVDALWKLGIPATTNPMGAGKWEPELNVHFAGADVIAISDNDPQTTIGGVPQVRDDGRPKHTGQDHADAVCESLLETAQRVRHLNLGKLWPECPPKGDISDWIAAGGSAEALWELVERVPGWTPPQPPAPAWAPKPYAWRDAAKIERRPFLFGSKHFQRKTIGVTVGAGGRLKTTVGLTEAIGMAAGRNLLTGDTFEPLRVWFMSGEETEDELDIRAAAICQAFRVKSSECGDRLFIQSVRNKSPRFAVLDKHGAAILDQRELGQLEAFIATMRLDVVKLDPMISFHRIVESSNEAIDLLVKEGLGGIADRTRCHIELYHHPGKPKPGQSENTVEDARGASALINAARSARVFNFMTPEGAKQLGVGEQDRRLHVRITNGKANPGPIGRADWVKIHVEKMANGDEIAVPTLWKPKNPFENVSTAQMQRCREVVKGGDFRADIQAKNWVGYMIGEVLGIDVAHGANNKPEDIARIKQIIKTWIKNGVLRVEKRSDEKSRSRSVVVPGAWSDPGLDAQDDDF